MRKETKKAPTIRFRGFTDDWEQRKLAHFFFTATEKNDDGEYSQADILAASLGTELEKKHIFFGLRSTAESVKKYRKVQLGDIVYTKSPIKHYPNGIFRTCKKIPGIVPSMYCVYHKRGNIKINTSIVQCFFENKYRLDNYLRPLVNVGARNNVNITDEEALKGTITIPINIEEQTKIVNLIEKLTILITLHQHKLDQLKKLKKFFLQNMFPAKGEKVPKIRFKGFTSDWEQHNLGEITSKIGSGKTPSGGAKAYVNQGTILIRSQNVHDDMVDFSDVVFIDDETNKSMKNSIVVINDILLNITGASIGRSAVYKSMKSANVNQHVCIIRPISGYYSDFIQLYISSENGQKQIDLSQAGGGREGLNFQQISKFEFAFPSYDEQVKIGEYFRYTNDLIACNQHKIEKLRTLKKYMLQNMFI